MRKILTIEEYIEVISRTIKETLEKDFPEGGHVSDLLTHTITQLDGIYYWMYAYPEGKDVD